MEKNLNALECNDPKSFDKLSEEQRTILLDWIDSTFGSKRLKSMNYRHTSYALRHTFSRQCGFCITNKQFKDAMKISGFNSRPINDCNEIYNISNIGLHDKLMISKWWEIEKNDPKNDVNSFNKMDEDRKRHLMNWINLSFSRRKGFCYLSSSRGLKHYYELEHEDDNIHITNGEFKGAMRACGFKFKPVDKYSPYEYYNI